MTPEASLAAWCCWRDDSLGRAGHRLGAQVAQAVLNCRAADEFSPPSAFLAAPRSGGGPHRQILNEMSAIGLSVTNHSSLRATSSSGQIATRSDQPALLY